MRTVLPRVDPNCCTELAQAREALREARRREAEAVKELFALQRAGAIPSDVRRVDSRVESLASQRSQNESILTAWLRHCARVLP